MNTIIKHRAIYVFIMGDKGKTGSFWVIQKDHWTHLLMPLGNIWSHDY